MFCKTAVQRMSTTNSIDDATLLNMINCIYHKEKHHEKYPEKDTAYRYSFVELTILSQSIQKIVFNW